MNEQEQDDILEPVIAKVFASMGQDITNPAIQKEIANTKTRLRTINPGVDDVALIAQLKSNLPATISAVTQSKRIDSGTDEQAELQAYKQQFQRDTEDAARRAARAYGAFNPLPGAAPENQAFFKDQQEQAFLPSAGIKKQIDANATFYDNQNKRAVAQKAEEDAQQAGIKTQSDRSKLINENAMNDHTSVLSTSIRSSLKSQLKAMGVPDAQLRAMDVMNAVQMRAFSDQFITTEKSRVEIDNAIKNGASERALKAAQSSQAYAAAGASNAQAGEARARTEGVNLENRQKKVITEGYENAPKAGQGGWGNVIPEVRDKTMPPALRANEEANNKEADRLVNESTDRKMIYAALKEANELIDKGVGGPMARLGQYIDADTQKLKKNLDFLRSKGIAVQRNAVGGEAASGSIPEIGAQPSAIRSALNRVQAQTDRDEIMAENLKNARSRGQIEIVDRKWLADNTKSFIVVDERTGQSKVHTYSPAQLNQGAYDQLVKSNPNKKIYMMQVEEK